MHFYVTHQANVFDILMMSAMLYDQLGTAFAVQSPNLAEIWPELDCAGLILFVKLQLLEFQFPNTNQHSSTGLNPKRWHSASPAPSFLCLSGA